MLKSDDEDSCCDPLQGDGTTKSDSETIEECDKDFHNMRSSDDEKLIQNEIENSSIDIMNAENSYDSETFVDYEIASSKGIERGLWGLSSVVPGKFSAMRQSAAENGELKIFDEDAWMNKDWSNESNDEIKDLVDMFIQETDNSRRNEEMEDDDHQTRVDVSNDSPLQIKESTLSQLSPRRQEACRSITASILKDEHTAKYIQTACPTWEENLTFVFHQNPKETKVALANVHRMRSKLDKVKELFLKNLEHRESVLQLYETALSQSLSIFLEN